MPTIEERIQKRAEELSRLKKQKVLKDAAAERRERSRARQADAHKKIELGGVVIASGSDDLDPAEICGILMTWMENRTAERAHAAREKGLARFEARKAAKGGKR